MRKVNFRFFAEYLGKLFLNLSSHPSFLPKGKQFSGLQNQTPDARTGNLNLAI